VIDASGAEASIQTAIYIVKAGGTVVQVGMGNPNVTMNVAPIIAKEIIYKGSFRYGPGDYPLAISLVANGKVDLKPLVTHRYKFDEAVIAFEATRAGKSNDGKNGDQSHHFRTSLRPNRFCGFGWERFCKCTKV